MVWDSKTPKEDFGSKLNTDNTGKNQIIKNEERGLSDQEIYDLLIEIDDRRVTTDDERQMLGEATSIEWQGSYFTKLPSSIGLLTSLLELRLRNSSVSDISALTNLTYLRSLDLGNTQVSDISALSDLKFLSSLYLSNTQVRDISVLSGLKNLRILDLGGIEIKNLNALSGLRYLEYLNLQNSKTTAIPKSILDLDLSFITKNKESIAEEFSKGIYIYGLTLSNQPIEIFSLSKELIRAYFREDNQIPVNECKVIFLGDAEAGKTYSIRRLLNDGEKLNSFDGESTPGIEISISQIKLTDTNIVVNYWDFGGQEIQHSMHRMFLTERTVYVVFLNARQDDQMDERARYWMENIKAFAPKAPVLVVINKIDQNEHPRFNEKGFMESYGNQVWDVIRISAKNDEQLTFIVKLQGNINSIIMEMPGVRKKIPKSWKYLMENVRKMEDYYITRTQFMKKCSEYGIVDYKNINKELVDLFQVIGVSFCYRKDRTVADYMLLNPKWMLNALYTIVVNGKVVARNGVITQDELFDLLEKDRVSGIPIRRVIPDLRYKSFEISYILGVIRMFGLSYCLKDGSEFFPMLCDGDEKISVKEAVPKNALHLIFRYKYLPINIVHRLIVEMQRDLDYRYVWYTGAVFRNELQNQSAYIHTIGNDLHIYAYGEEEYYNLNEYLTPITNNLRNINKDLGLSAIEFLTLRKNGIEAEISREEVEGNLRNGVTTVYNPTLKEMISLNDLTHRYTDKRLKTDKFLESIVSALREMQNNMNFYSCDEDFRNSFVTVQLKAQLKGTGYTCSEQQRAGVGATGKAPGERDIVVKDENGQESLIYEGMNLSGFNRTYIDKHIKKVLVNYNPQGLRYSVLVTYLECGRDQFMSFTDKYRKHIEGFAPETYSCVGKAKVIPAEGAFLDCMKMDYKVGGSCLTVYHIIVRMGE